MNVRSIRFRNAIKYTQEGGTVEVRVRQDGNAVILEVCDNGPGIPASALPHVFGRFYRADKGRCRDLGDAGLGLAIVKSICSAHGAEISVSRQEGFGSCFRRQMARFPAPKATRATVPQL